MTNYITSIQKVSITIATGSTSNTATISSVTTNNTVIFYDGFNTQDGNYNVSCISVTLTNATTVTATRGTSSAGSTTTVKCTVVEFISAAVNVAAQYGSISTTGTSGTAGITSVTTANSALFFLGWQSPVAAASTSGYCNIELTSSTVVTLSRAGGTGTMVGNFCVIEFASAVVNLVQHRSVTLSTNATAPTDTITSVVMANTMLLYGGVNTAVNAPNSCSHYLSLSSTTAVTITRSGVSTSARTIKYDVLEFKSGVLNSMQRGSTTLNSVASITTTITSVNSSYAVLNFCNFSTDSSSTTSYDAQATAAVLTSGTLITTTKNTASSVTSIGSWEIAEFNSVTLIAFDAASNSGYQTAQSSYSWNHTCTGNERFLVVGVSMLSVLGSSVTSITYGGISMAFLGAKASATGAIRAEMWGMVAPSSGTNSIAVTLSTGLDSAGTACSFTGVNQTSATEAFNSATATNVGAADATVNVATVADNDWTVDIVATDDTAITVGAGNTSRANVTGTLGSGALGTAGPKTPAGSVTMNWTNVGALATWSIVAIALRPSSDANTSSVVFRKTLSGIGTRVGTRQVQGWN